MWLKETFRALSANPKMTLAEQGALWNLLRFAWDKQGIAENDLPELARSLREPVETFRSIWPDFVALATEQNGFWMTPEMWEAVDAQRKRIKAAQNAGNKSAERRAQKTKDLPPTVAKHSSTHGQRTANESELDLDLDLDKSKRKQSKSHSRAKSREPGDVTLKDSCLADFRSVYLSAYGTPYLDKTGDFVKFWHLLDKCRAMRWELDLARWLKAQGNYFASPVKHTFADLCVSFSTYFKSAIDRYGKPIGESNGTTQGQPTTRKESAEERRLREFAEDCGYDTTGGIDFLVGGNGAQTEGAADDGTSGAAGYIEIVDYRVG